jgi:hypothetical protein
MLRRMLLMLVVLLTVAVIGVSLIAYWSRPAHSITSENIARIRTGMTLREVADLLGGPPGNHSRGMVRGGVPLLALENAILSDRTDWIGDETSVLVLFSPEGLVTHHIQLDVHPSGEGWFLRWLPFR